MTIVLLIAAIVVTYALLITFKQLQTLKERVERLEAEKRETEELLLSFMESMNDVVQAGEPSAVPAMSVTVGETDQVEPETPATGHLVEDVLLHHSVRETARLLGKGEGEVALYAKLRKK
ncbi:hypothetical protein [Exiguobacterium sp.]|uniref:hypothetical protein n=1 Tax=Exiguobacterium sp. TaxID=44751 RepID=UPI00263AEFEA|nr:hypothetical protein [Exiguobacterium sp.]MCC5892249.1 hypothetical protein [Exiguobacterium sp.]